VSSEQTKALSAVKRAQTRLDAAKLEREEAVLTALGVGVTRRAVREATGQSHATFYRHVRRLRERAAA
jgi:hypothetical protein